MKKMSKNPLFLSGGLKEYRLKHDGSLWYIVPFKSGSLPRRLQGKWMSIVEAEQVLINYLDRQDKFNRAIHPRAKSLNK